MRRGGRRGFRGRGVSGAHRGRVFRARLFSFARVRARDRLQIERMQRFIPLAEQLAGDENGLALLTMLLDDSYHSWMHQPPELPPVVSESQSRKPRRRKRKSGYKRGGKKGG